MMHELSISEIGERIYFLRGQRVMLDSTLAEFYQVETSTLKRTVRRNVDRFPEDFMFELSGDEMKILNLELGISEFGVLERRGGNRHAPFAFTEPGVAMLSSVLKSERAVQVNISIIRAFIHLRLVKEKVAETSDRVDHLSGRLENCPVRARSTGFRS